MRWSRAWGGLVASALALVLGLPRPARSDRFVYAADANFPPFEYADRSGAPAGFNVALIRALARAAGHEVEVRTGVWSAQREALDRGRADLMALAWSEARDRQYAFLVQFWTLRESVVLPAGRRPEGTTLDSFAAEIVAVERQSLMHERMEALPEANRPVLLPVSDHAAAVRAMLRGEATAVCRARDGRITWANRAAVELAAPARDSLVGTPVADLWAEPAEWTRLVERLGTEGRQATELRLRSTDGPQRWSSVTARSAEAGGERQIVFAMQSVTSWRRHEETARATLSALPDLMFRVSPDGTLVDFHAPDASLLAVPPERFLGQPASKVLPEAVAVPLLEAVARARRDGAAGPVEYQLPDADGRLRDWEARAVRMRQGDVLTVTRDVTEQRRAAARLVSLRESLREKERLATIGGVAAGVAHEVRNPLFGATACLDALEDRVGPSEESQLIRSQLLRIGLVTESLLELGRPPSGEIQPAPLLAVIAKAVEQCESLRRSRGVLLRQELPVDLPPIPMNSHTVTQAVRNLLDNAIQVSPPQAAVALRVSVDDGAARIEVSDQGPGVDPELAQRIFEPFFTRRPGGTGLGLAIVRRVALDHRGEIDVESLPTGGTRFTLRLPLKGEAGSAPQAGPAPPAAD